MAVPATIKKAIDYLMGNDINKNYNGDVEGEDIDDISQGYDYGEEDEIEGENNGSNVIGLFKRNSPKTAMQQQIRMKISKPVNIDQVEDIITDLKNRNAIVINLEYVNKDIARRIFDIVSGAIKALDGHIEKVSNSIFVIAPFNYTITNESTKEKIESKFSTSWVNNK